MGKKSDSWDRGYDQGFSDGYDQGERDRNKFYAKEVALSQAVGLGLSKAWTARQVTEAAESFVEFLGQRL